jgi:hypothetical protein
VLRPHAGCQLQALQALQAAEFPRHQTPSAIVVGHVIEVICQPQLLQAAWECVDSLQLGGS